MLKTLSIIAVILLFGSFRGIAQSPWIPLERPTQERLTEIHFLTKNLGWVAGGRGTILKTVDGGSSWLQQNSGITNDLVDLFILNERLGWAIGWEYPSDTGSWYGSVLLRTTNGGNGWQAEILRDQFFNAVYFLDSLRGWMGGELGLLQGTRDGGETWIPAIVDSAQFPIFPIRAIKFQTAERGYAVGGIREIAGVIWRTTNGGERWKQTSIGDELYDLQFIDSLNILAVGGGLDDGAGVARSIDGGNSWIFYYVGILGQGRAVDFRIPGEAWVPLGGTGSYMVTTNAGEQWTEMFTPDSSAVYNITCLDSTTGYMVGHNGLLLKYRPPAVNVTIHTGWNLLSLPVNPPVKGKNALFPASISPAFAYTGAYISVDTLSVGQGFWLKFDAGDVIPVAGIYTEDDTIDVRAKWNIIGTVSVPIPVGSLTTEPDSLLLSPFFGFEDSYKEDDTLKPGKGYWVKTRSEGRIILRADGMASFSSAKKSSEGHSILEVTDAAGKTQQLRVGIREDMNAVTVTDELPPLPPIDVFDVRYMSAEGQSQGGRSILFPSSTTTRQSVTLHLQGVRYPLTARLTGFEDRNQVYLLSVRSSGDTALIRLHNGGQFILQEQPSLVTLTAETAERPAVPKEFVLHQNYPNPFNPSTVIRYELPVESYVSLRIYTILGQEIAAPVQETQPAGTYAIPFNASEFPGGVYLVRLDAGSHHPVRKILLLR